MGVFGNWSLHNFSQVFGSPGFWSTPLGTTLAYTIGGTADQWDPQKPDRGNRPPPKPFRGRGLLRSTILLPSTSPPVVAVSFVWQTALSPQYGIVNHWGGGCSAGITRIAFLSTRGSKVNLLGWHFGLPLALMTVIAFEAWRYFPFAFLFLLARLQAVPHGPVEEAARVDGATPSQQFRYILLPQLMPVIALLAVLRFILTFNKFDDVFLLTGGGSGTDVVAVRVYNFLVSRGDLGASAAQALVLAMTLVILMIIYTRASKRSEESPL